jgi:very-short-patch-repair endonuclease
MDKFLQVAWTADEITGEADFDIGRENVSPAPPFLPLSDFRPTKIKAFERELEHQLRAGQPRDEAAVVRLCLEHGVRRRHAEPVLKKLKEERIIAPAFRRPKSIDRDPQGRFACRSRILFFFPLLGKEGARGRSLLTLHFNRRSERGTRKRLRSHATAAEQRLWQQLKGRRLGAKFRRQYSVDAYVLDFYAPRARVAIEVDGDSHYTAAAIAYDRERTAHLNRFGIDVLRFTNLEIGKHLDQVLESIRDAVHRRSATSPSPPPS